MTAFGKGFVLGGLSTAFMLGTKIMGVNGWFILLIVFVLAAFFTWLPDKYITGGHHAQAKGKRESGRHQARSSA